MSAGHSQAVSLHPAVPEPATARHILHRDHISDSDVRTAASRPKTQNLEHDDDQIQLLVKHRGSSVNNFFNGLFTTIIAISTLSTSITFSFVLSNQTVPPPDSSPFSAEQVQLFLAISWLSSLLCLATAALGSTLLTFYRKHWVQDWDGDHGDSNRLAVQLYAVSVSTVMGCLLTAAFIFMCLVVTAYQPVVGWISLGFTSFFGLVIVFSICKQVPWNQNNNTSMVEKNAMA